MSKKQQIINAGIRLFVEKGLQGTSMALLAKEAGVAAGSIYTYFSSKEEMINAIFFQIREAELEFTFSRYDESAPVKERFFTFYHSLVTYMAEHPAEFQFCNMYCFSPVIEAEAREKLHELYAPLSKVYDDGYASGEIIKGDTIQQNLQVYGSLTFAIHWKIHHQENITEHDIQQFIQFAWNAIATKPQEHS